MFEMKLSKNFSRDAGVGVNEFYGVDDVEEFLRVACDVDPRNFVLFGRAAYLRDKLDDPDCSYFQARFFSNTMSHCLFEGSPLSFQLRQEESQ